MLPKIWFIADILLGVVSNVVVEVDVDVGCCCFESKLRRLWWFQNKAELLVAHVGKIENEVSVVLNSVVEKEVYRTWWWTKGKKKSCETSKSKMVLPSLIWKEKETAINFSKLLSKFPQRKESTCLTKHNLFDGPGWHEPLHWLYKIVISKNENG